MTRFALRRRPFGRHPGADEATDGLPSPHRAKLSARRAAGIAEARAVLEHLPSPGESLHAVCTARMDLTDVIGALLSQLGRCPRMRIATLGYHRRNLKTMLAWLDQGAVASLSLVASIFFRSHNGDLWQETRSEFRQRGQRAACCHSHAKVVTLAFASGEGLSIEGSANLCGNGSGREQFALIHDGGLHDFHAGWIDELVTKHEGNEGDRRTAG
jgi:hypothetical protein